VKETTVVALMIVVACGVYCASYCIWPTKQKPVPCFVSYTWATQQASGSGFCTVNISSTIRDHNDLITACKGITISGYPDATIHPSFIWHEGKRRYYVRVQCGRATYCMTKKGTLTTGKWTIGYWPTLAEAMQAFEAWKETQTP
jgi:hypothetical protein